MVDSYSDILPRMLINFNVIDSKSDYDPGYIKPTRNNPIIGIKPNYFPDFLRTISTRGDTRDNIIIYYYDVWNRPTVEYIN